MTRSVWRRARGRMTARDGQHQGIVPGRAHGGQPDRRRDDRQRHAGAADQQPRSRLVRSRGSGRAGLQPGRRQDHREPEPAFRLAQIHADLFRRDAAAVGRQRLRAVHRRQRPAGGLADGGVEAHVLAPVGGADSGRHHAPAGQRGQEPDCAEQAGLLRRHGHRLYVPSVAGPRRGVEPGDGLPPPRRAADTPWAGARALPRPSCP